MYFTIKFWTHIQRNKFYSKQCNVCTPNRLYLQRNSLFILHTLSLWSFSKGRGGHIFRDSEFPVLIGLTNYLTYSPTFATLFILQQTLSRPSSAAKDIKCWNLENVKLPPPFSHFNMLKDIFYLTYMLFSKKLIIL